MFFDIWNCLIPVFLLKVATFFHEKLEILPVALGFMRFLENLKRLIDILFIFPGFSKTN